MSYPEGGIQGGIGALEQKNWTAFAVQAQSHYRQGKGDRWLTQKADFGVGDVLWFPKK